MPGLGFTHVTILELDEADVAEQADRVLDRDEALRSDGRMHPAHVTVSAEVFAAHGPGARIVDVDGSHQKKLFDCTSPCVVGDEGRVDQGHVLDEARLAARLGGTGRRHRSGSPPGSRRSHRW